jgi:tetratricopeptide (TPR) repeat protein
VTAATAVSIILALAWGAFIQTSYWRNSGALWTHALAVTSDNDVAHNNLGYLFNDRGEQDEAISHFESAARIRSAKRDPHYNLASAFVQMNLGDALARRGRSDDAMRHYDEAIRLQPDYGDAYYNRGAVLLSKGRIDEAIADLAKALEMQPSDADAHTSLGNALLQKGSLREAIAHYQTALALAPEDPHSRNNLAWILATASDSSIRDGAKALGFAQEAVQLSGGREPLFLRTLAAAYAESGRFSEAIVVTQQAVGIANMQAKPDMVRRLNEDLVLFRGKLPLRESPPGN